MTRASIEYIKPTERGNMTKARATRIFLSNNGICCLCGGQIRAHIDSWFIEHPEALNLGGSDDDNDLRPAHTKCKPGKDAADKALIAERNGFITKNCADVPKNKNKRPFPKHQDQKERGFHLRFLDHRADRGAEWFYESGTLHAFLKRKGHAGQAVVYKKQVIEKVIEHRAPSVVVAFPGVKMPEPIPPRMVGYARVSTEDQNLDMQLAMLRQAGVQDEDLFMDKLSAVNAKRPYFSLMLKHVYPGDTLVIYAMNRLSREVRQLYEILDQLKALGVSVKSLTEPHLDLTTSHGRMMLTITAAVDQNERERIQSRTKDGMAERKRQGMYLGRKRKVSDEDAEEMKRLRAAGKSAAWIAKKFDCAEGTVYNYTREAEDAA